MREFINIVENAITEDTIQNMDAVRAAADLAIQYMPNVPINDILTFMIPERACIATSKQFGDSPHAAALAKLHQVQFVINGRSETSTAGAFQSSPTLKIAVFTKNFSGDEGFVSNDAHKRLANQAIKSVYSTLVHELRHYFQYHLISKTTKEYPYRVDPMEIDAAWMHHLIDYSPDEYGSAAAYAEELMASFSRYKDLTPKQTEHFRRKTIRYWIEVKAGHSPKDALTIVQRLAKKKKAIGDALADRVMAFEPDKQSLDLRDIVPGYEGNWFLLPSNFRTGIAQRLRSQKMGSGDAILAYLFLAASGTKSADTEIAFVEKISGVSFDEALDHPLGNFTKEPVVAFIRKELRRQQ